MDEQKNNTAPEPARARLKGWVKAVFIASITLNLLVGGVILGGVIRHDRHPPRTVVSDISMGPFTQALSNEDRQARRRAAQAESTGVRAMRQAAREADAQLLAALRAEPWDEAAVQDVLAGQRDRLLQRWELGQRLMLGRVAEMSPDERHAFADRLEQAMERRQTRSDRRPPE